MFAPGGIKATGPQPEGGPDGPLLAGAEPAPPISSNLITLQASRGGPETWEAAP